MSTATFVRSAVNPGVISSAEPMETDEAFYETVHGQRVEMPPMSVRAVDSRFPNQHRAEARSRGRSDWERYSRNCSSTCLCPRMRVGTDGPMSRSSLILGRRRPVTELPNVNAWDVIPDLAIEVTSPSDRAEAQREKVLEYFRAGVRFVWVVYPNLRLIDVYETPTTIRVFGPDGTLAGDPVLPGFQLSFADLFAPFAPPSA